MLHYILSIMSNYWSNRIDEETLFLMDKTEAEIEAELAKSYATAIKHTIKDITSLYNKLIAESEDGKVRPNDLYKYDRYFKMMANLNAELTKLGRAEINIYNKDFLDMYDKVQDKITEIAPNRISISMVGEGKAQDVLNSVWCQDGKH